MMRKSWKFSVNTMVSILLVLGIAVFALMLSYSHNKRFDMTEEKKFTLSEQTIKIMKSLDSDVKAYVFFSSGTNYREEAERLLNQYRYYSKNLSIIPMDAVRNPMEVKEYNLSSMNAIVITTGDRREIVNTVSEETVTNALKKVLQTGKKSAYFVIGHGEKDINKKEFNQISALKDALVKDNYEVRTINLMETEKIPEDCDVLIIAGPESDFLELELKSIEDYLDRGGSLKVMLHFKMKLERLSNFLEKRGLHINNDLVLDDLSMRAFGSPVYPVIIMYNDHSIVRDFKNLMTFFPHSCSLEIKPTAIVPVQWETLISTNASSLSRPTSAITGKINLTFNPKTDKKGPLAIAVAGTRRINDSPVKSPDMPETDSSKRKESRLIVLGSVDIATSQYFSQAGNADFVLNSISWLAEQENLISIRPASSTFKPLTLTETDKRNIRVLSVFLLPGLVIIAGVLVFINKNI